MPTNDPYYEQYTARGTIKRQIRHLWPGVYRVTNGAFRGIINVVKTMLAYTWRAIRGQF